MKKLAIVTTHPVQYNAPWFRLLARRMNVDLHVFYTWSQSVSGAKYDPDFQRNIEWDIPLLDGYNYSFVHNSSKDPGSHHFNGIINPTLKKDLLDWNPDSILFIGWSFRSHLSCMRYFKNRKQVLFRGDSTLIDESPGLKRMLRRIFLRWVYKSVDKVLPVGTSNRGYFEALGISAEQMVTAYHAIDNLRFSAPDNRCESELRVLRQRSGIESSSFVILFAGKLEPKKNPSFLLQLARLLPDNNYTFLIVGNGKMESDLKTQAAGDPRIKFLDFQNQSVMPLIYQLATVFILPSTGPGETWGLAANEAMAAGKPVILSSKAGGSCDLVKDNGLIFEPSDLDGVARFIRKLSSTPSLTMELGQNSMRHIQEFNFEQIAKAVEKACYS